MKTVILEYDVTPELVEREFIEHGGDIPAHTREVVISLTSPTIRQAWVELAGLQPCADLTALGLKAYGQSALIPDMRQAELLTPESATALILDLKPQAEALKAEYARLKAEKEAQKRQWIEDLGSEHLNQIYAQGFNSQHTYVTERLAHEAGDFYKLDFYNNAQIKPRSDPSREAMKVLAQAQAIGLGEPKIGWMVKPIQEQPQKGKPLPMRDFVQCEVVYVEGYLEKYTLIRTV